MPSITKYLEDYVLKPTTGGLLPGGSPADEDRNLFVGSEDSIKSTLLREYATWYEGDGDRLLHMYTKNNLIDYSTEPWFWKNRRSFFWCVSSTEEDVPRTHSGLPANMVNTLCNIVGTPQIEGPEILDEILKESEFYASYSDECLPMSLVEGWGAWKVGWDLDVSEHPYIIYYRAENVQFIRKNGKTIAMVFFDWYKGTKDCERYLVTEIRRIESRKTDDGKIARDLHIEIRSWKVSGDIITPIENSQVEALQGIESDMVIENLNGLLARPVIIFKNATDSIMPGKSLFSNKIALFDMLDGILSQENMAVQKSTVEELFNTDFLERDENNMPIMPKRYDRKYTTFAGGRTAEGGQMSSEPVQVTQPAIDFSKYNAAALEVVSHILSGDISPATIGINVAVQSTAQSQREKEKVTIATRKRITDALEPVLCGICNDALKCEEYLRGRKIPTEDYDITVKYSEFPNVEFSEKSQVYTQMLVQGAMTPENYVEKMYADETDDFKAREIEFLKQNFDRAAQMQAMMGANPEGGE